MELWHIISCFCSPFVTDNTLDGNVKAKVCANGTDFSTNEQCGLQCTPTRVSDTVQYFLCDPPSYVRYIILAVKPSADVSTPETVHLKIAEVTVEQHLSGVGPCLNWDGKTSKLYPCILFDFQAPPPAPSSFDITNNPNQNVTAYKLAMLLETLETFGNCQSPVFSPGVC